MSASPCQWFSRADAAYGRAHSPCLRCWRHCTPKGSMTEAARQPGLPTISDGPLSEGVGTVLL